MNRKRVALFEPYGIDWMSLNDLREDPPLHDLYRRSGNCQALHLALRASLAPNIEEVDVLGETLLFKAVKSHDEKLGGYPLHHVAEYAENLTMEMLETLRWNTANIDDFINGMGILVRTPYSIINWRRSNNTTWAQERNREPDSDPEMVFQSFIKLVQKIVDDHYDSNGEHLNKHKVLVPEPGSRYLVIVEETLANERFLEVSDDDELQNDDEESEEEENWEDAWEQNSGLEGQ
ncbi:MAG: hypothetical protein L6R38_000250 [Xanthoria sp. 2 TBL-2021]|nr:MAG: hypothetical protein L6R38_000250 [Xanthoria sp. 2 TBL-2021]